MKTSLVSLLTCFAALACAAHAFGQTSESGRRSTDVIRIVDDGGVRHIALNIVVVDGDRRLSLDEYWSQTIRALFTFADRNADGVLTDDEALLLPSARAIRMSLGNGFAPPIAPLRSVAEITEDRTPRCSLEQLEQYYRRNGVGRAAMGVAALPHTSSLTAALVAAIDVDRDGVVSERELGQAETRLKRIDANDDELIGVEELITDAAYPGRWAVASLSPTTPVDLAPGRSGRFTLERLEWQADAAAAPAELLPWEIELGDDLRAAPLPFSSSSRYESWTVASSLPSLQERLREEIAAAEADPPVESQGPRNRERRPSRAWLTPLVDRDGDQQASPEEIHQWLALQQQLTRGQALISLYSGGGLFELLDADHDAALSVRELRSAWQTLSDANCTQDNCVEIARIPNIVMVVVSQGYPRSLARTSKIDLAWFLKMDRNSDGDVSRREFTGSPAAFARLDQNQDGLISAPEAAGAKQE